MVSESGEKSNNATKSIDSSLSNENSHNESQQNDHSSMGLDNGNNSLVKSNENEDDEEDESRI